MTKPSQTAQKTGATREEAPVADPSCGSMSVDSSTSVIVEASDEKRIEAFSKTGAGFVVDIIALTVIAMAMVVVGSLPLFVEATAKSVSESAGLTILCVELILIGGIILYTVVYSVFRIIERKQRRTYDWYANTIQKSNTSHQASDNAVSDEGADSEGLSSAAQSSSRETACS